jgi:hypothetical protein
MLWEWLRFDGIQKFFKRFQQINYAETKNLPGLWALTLTSLYNFVCSGVL